MKAKYSKRKGAALIQVVIAMIVISILGTLVMSISYSNYSMKQIDKNAKDNFYTAESGLEDIVAIIEKEVAYRYTSSYSTIMENYAVYESDSNLSMEEDFKTYFITGIVDDLCEDVASTNPKYRTDIFDNAFKRADGSNKYPGTMVASFGSQEIGTLNDGVILRDIGVTYTNNGYENSIKTDIKISVPTIKFSLISTMADISNYAYISQGGLELNGGTTLKLIGEAFSNDAKLNSGSNTTLDLEDASLFVVKENVEIGNSSIVKTGENTSLWAKGIELLQNSTLTLKGKTYVKDDLTVSKDGSTVNLGGQYYGYSNSDTDSNQSSAIIINGKNTTVNSENLSTFVVSGTAFISASSINGTTNNESVVNSNNLTGDSFAIKGNQIAYLVPVECEGIPSNPMGEAQYSALISTPDWEETALNTVLPSIRRSIASYGEVSINPVFYSTIKEKSIYLFLQFENPTVAGKFFDDIYNSNNSTSNKLKDYFRSYIRETNINMEDVTRVVSGGNYLVKTILVNDKIVPVYSESIMNSGNIANELNNYSDSFRALCAKLVSTTAGLTGAELSNTVFNNIIDEGAIHSFFASGIAPIESGNKISLNSNGISSIIVDNEGGAAYPVEGNNNKGILIATGDVLLRGTTWEGIIICKGRLVVEGTSSLISNEAVANYALGQKWATGSINEYNFSSFFVGSSTNFSNMNYTVDIKNDIRNFIGYENYGSQ